MKKSIYFLFCLCFCQIYFAQTTTLYFKYDEAGNQKYRGTDINANRMITENSQTPLVESAVVKKVNEDDVFFSKLSIYPVPVKNILTIEWAEKVDGLIRNISLYEHNTVHWVFQRENKPELNRRVEIDMTGYYMGVYIVTFQLKDGRVISKNIIKQ